MSGTCPFWLLPLFFFFAAVAPAAAQDAAAGVSPAPGVRAAGMGGAFTAVADDASAAYWNPAGLATAGFFSLVVDRNAGNRGSSASLIAIGTPPLGFSYYRTATGDRSNGRNSLIAHHAGVTVLQSLGGRLTVGGTLKLVHGNVRSGSGAEGSTTKFDMDLGVMASGEAGRIGVTVHNVTEPDFAGPGATVTLARQVRAGVSLNVGSMTSVAADVDLAGDRRQAAVGTEVHPVRTGWLRGGLHWKTTGGEAAPVGSVGGSYAIYGSALADAQVSFGSDKGDRGWGIGLRFIF